MYTILLFSALGFAVTNFGALYLDALKKFQNYEYKRHKCKIIMTFLVILLVCVNIVSQFVIIGYAAECSLPFHLFVNPVTDKEKLKETVGPFCERVTN